MRTKNNRMISMLLIAMMATTIMGCGKTEEAPAAEPVAAVEASTTAASEATTGEVKEEEKVEEPAAQEPVEEEVQDKGDVNVEGTVAYEEANKLLDEGYELYLNLLNDVDKMDEETFKNNEKQARENYAQVKEKYMQALEMGSNRAYTLLGKLDSIKWVGEGLEKTGEWFEEGAKHGSASSMIWLAFYLAGDGDYDSAREWLIKSADNGNAEACLELAADYQIGNETWGIEKNHDLFDKYCDLAFELGDDEIKGKADYLSGNEHYNLAEELYGKDPAKAQEEFTKALGFYKEGCVKYYNNNCAARAGTMLYLGIGVDEPDYEQAYNALRSAARWARTDGDESWTVVAELIREGVEKGYFDEERARADDVLID